MTAELVCTWLAIVTVGLVVFACAVAAERSDTSEETQRDLQWSLDND